MTEEARVSVKEPWFYENAVMKFPYLATLKIVKIETESEDCDRIYEFKIVDVTKNVELFKKVTKNDVDNLQFANGHFNFTYLNWKTKVKVMELYDLQGMIEAMPGSASFKPRVIELERLKKIRGNCTSGIATKTSFVELEKINFEVEMKPSKVVKKEWSFWSYD